MIQGRYFIPAAILLAGALLWRDYSGRRSPSLFTNVVGATLACLLVLLCLAWQRVRRRRRQANRGE